jgi:hypothetical protein
VNDRELLYQTDDECVSSPDGTWTSPASATDGRWLTSYLPLPHPFNSLVSVSSARVGAPPRPSSRKGWFSLRPRRVPPGRIGTEIT